MYIAGLSTQNSFVSLNPLNVDLRHRYFRYLYSLSSLLLSHEKSKLKVRACVLKSLWCTLNHQNMLSFAFKFTMKKKVKSNQKQLITATACISWFLSFSLQILYSILNNAKIIANYFHQCHVKFIKHFFALIFFFLRKISKILTLSQITWRFVHWYFRIGSL